MDQDITRGHMHGRAYNTVAYCISPLVHDCKVGVEVVVVGELKRVMNTVGMCMCIGLYKNTNSICTTHSSSCMSRHNKISVPRKSAYITRQSRETEYHFSRQSQGHH